MTFTELLATKQLLDLVDPDGKRLREKRLREMKTKLEVSYITALVELNK